LGDCGGIEKQWASLYMGKDASLHRASETLTGSWYTSHWFYKKRPTEWSSLRHEKNNSPAIAVVLESMGREEELFSVPLL